MKTSYQTFFFAFLISLFSTPKFSAQTLRIEQQEKRWIEEAKRYGYNEAATKEFIEGQKQLQRDLNSSSPTSSSQTKYSPSQVSTATCINMDFEDGTTNGWVPTTGYNPLFNSAGCCLNSGGTQSIVTGTGIDPYGGFPLVAPGGSFSLKIGNTAVGGIADRISQTFFVNSQNALFTFKYATVLNDGGTSHTTSQQANFQVQVVDSLDSDIPCSSIIHFANASTLTLLTSSLQANGNAVRYKPWTAVTVDLSAYIGTNVTLKFTVYDCAPTGHFAYAYVDADCLSNLQASSYSVCSGSSVQMCGVPSFSSYVWTTPSTATLSGSCISASVAGTYTCATMLQGGCPGPSFIYTLNTISSPSPQLNLNTGGACSLQYTYNASFTGTTTSQLLTFGDNTQTSNLSGIHTYTTTGSYPVKFKVTSQNGCSDSIQQVINIYSPPLVSASVNTTCLNSLTSFLNTSTINNGTIVATQWNVGVQTYTTNAVNHVFNNVGVQLYTLTVASNQGCSSTLTSSITVNPLPVAFFIADTICLGAQTGFTNTSFISSGNIIAYTWNFGDNSQSLFTNPVHQYPLSGLYTVSLTALSNFGCLSTATKTIMVRSNPSITVNSGSICAGQNFTIIPGGASSYSISGGQFIVAPLQSSTYLLVGIDQFGCSSLPLTSTLNVFQNPTVSVNSGSICAGDQFVITPSGAQSYIVSGGSFTVSPISKTNYTIVGTDSVGCISQNISVSSVTVKSLPIVTLGSGTICLGKTFTLIPSGGMSYTYLPQGPIVQPVATTNYSIIGIDSSGCKSKMVTNTLTVYANPTVTANALKDSICEGEKVILVAGGGATFSWSSGQNTYSFAASPTITTTYSVNAMDSNGCGGKDSVQVKVLPTPTVSAIAIPSIVCKGETATIIASGATNYTWSINVFGSSFTISPVTTMTLTGVGSATNECTSSFSVVQNVDACVGIIDQEEEDLFEIFPNPSGGIIQIKNVGETNYLSLRIYNNLGQLLKFEDHVQPDSIIDLTAFAKGVYYLVVKDENGEKVFKVLLQ